MTFRCSPLLALHITCQQGETKLYYLIDMFNSMKKVKSHFDATRLVLAQPDSFFLHVLLEVSRYI